MEGRKMEIKWFGSHGIGINIEELKTRYRELCKKWHPDLGGDTAKMQEINLEYEYCLKFARIDDRKTKQNRPLSEDEIRVEKDIMEVVQRVIVLKGLVVEVCGRWVWVTGETWNWKKQLKVLGLVWASGKKAWYWRPADARCSSRYRIPLERIREKYGSIGFENVERETIS
jgi:hypothetical protein